MNYELYKTFRPCMRPYLALPIAVGVIAGSLLLIYGLEDKNADYFKKGRFVTNTEGWEYRWNGVIWPYGLMVSHWSVIVILTIVFMLIFWIGYEGVRAIRK